MKANYVLNVGIVCALLMCGCSSPDEPAAPSAVQDVGQFHGLIQLADNAMESVYPAKSRGISRKATDSGVKVVSGTRSRFETDTLIYVVNYENDGGFVMLSATNEESPVLAVVPEGNYDPAFGSENMGFNIFVELATEEAKSYSGNTLQKANSGVSAYSDVPTLGADGKYHKTTRFIISKHDVYPWMGEELKWGQIFLYGAYCPNKKCGCGPLAIGSIATYMFHFNDPDHYLTYKFAEADKTYEKLDYADMFRHKSEETYDINTGKNIVPRNCSVLNEDTHKMIGRFLRQIGVSCGATYTNSETSTTESATLREFKNYLYPHEVTDWTNFDANKVADALEFGICLMYGNAPKLGGGHYWVCDGVRYTKTDVTEYEAENSGSDLQWYIKYNYVEISNLNYMHWGESGQYDGWFSGTPFNLEGQYVSNVKYSYAEFIDDPYDYE